MRRIAAWVLILVAALSAGCGGAGVTAGGPSPNYRSPARGFAITFPPDWEVKENELGLDVAGLSPMEGPSDKFRDNVTVASSDMPKPMDAEAILDGNIPSMINVITDFTPEGRGKVKLGGRDASWLRYTQRQGVFRLTVTLYSVAGRKRAYLVHCTSETSAVDRFRPKCEGVINSFKVIE